LKTEKNSFLRSIPERGGGEGTLDRILKHIDSPLARLQGYLAENETLQVSTVKSYPVDGIHTPTLEPVLKVQCREDFVNVLFMKEN